jgi:hypothetical protein
VAITDALSVKKSIAAKNFENMNGSLREFSSRTNLIEYWGASFVEKVSGSSPYYAYGKISEDGQGGKS